MLDGIVAAPSQLGYTDNFLDPKFLLCWLMDGWPTSPQSKYLRNGFHMAGKAFLFMFHFPVIYICGEWRASEMDVRERKSAPATVSHCAAFMPLYLPRL